MIDTRPRMRTVSSTPGRKKIRPGRNSTKSGLKRRILAQSRSLLHQHRPHHQRGLHVAGASPAEIIRQAALFGARSRDGWNTGLTILTALGNLLPLLPEEETYLALFKGARRVAADCKDEPPRRERAPLARKPDLGTLESWLRRWTAVRDREAAERTLLTAIATGATPAQLAAMLFTAETDRTFADGGHSLDFVNKAFECLDLIGWEHASAVLPTVVGQMTAARGSEESITWRQPVDIVALLDDDPVAIVEALKGVIAAGATPIDLGRALAYAAALRVAHFGTANEHSNWETAHHTFTYCNAVHQALKRIGPDERDEVSFIGAVRGIFHPGYPTLGRIASRPCERCSSCFS